MSAPLSTLRAARPDRATVHTLERRRGIAARHGIGWVATVHNLLIDSRLREAREGLEETRRVPGVSPECPTDVAGAPAPPSGASPQSVASPRASAVAA